MLVIDDDIILYYINHFLFLNSLDYIKKKSLDYVDNELMTMIFIQVHFSFKSL